MEIGDRLEGGPFLHQRQLLPRGNIEAAGDIAAFPGCGVTP
jgi:hypothetical protein